MGRHKASRSAIQADPVLFSKIVEEIHAIGAVPLSNLGLINRTTLFEYTKGLPVTAKTEQAIIDSIALWQSQEKNEAESRAQQARELVAL